MNRSANSSSASGANMRRYASRTLVWNTSTTSNGEPKDVEIRGICDFTCNLTQNEKLPVRIRELLHSERGEHVCHIGFGVCVFLLTFATSYSIGIGAL